MTFLDNMRGMGIYAITNIENGKVYIGSTVGRFKKRWGIHKYYLRKGTHANPHLQYAWDLYSEAAFEFGVLEYLDDPEELHLAEQFWVDIYREEGKKLYNCGLIARGPMLGRSMSAEACRKIEKTSESRHLAEESSRRTSKARAKPYPAFIHRDTDQVIPAGVNLTAMCYEWGLCPSAMWQVKTGKCLHHRGWALLRAAE